MNIPRELETRLLGRPAEDLLTADDRSALSGQPILITGAGGSVGSELARQIAPCRPGRLTLFEQSEYALFTIERELRQSFPDLHLDCVLGDVTRASDIGAACRRARPRVVYHAAAYKHVVITETAIIPAVRTNVLGTLEAAQAARHVGARFVLISSDKAAEPTSVMGATKRLAEIVAAGCATPLFRPLAVRFGNILGSSGSLVEIMGQCVDEGRDIPLTDPDATRYFMAPAEAAQLVLKADLIGHASEVLWLDMGDPVRIGDIVDRFLDWAEESGARRPGVRVIGLRPGEKATEVLTVQGLSMRKTADPRIWSARQAAGPDVAPLVRRLRTSIAAGDAAATLRILERSVAGYTPSDTAHASAWAEVSARPRSRYMRAVPA